ncbi:hypothetical protein FGO68_gene15782 [Halteria grandinella]|uniref:Uncharacterized protein n=1 Tax=Halteria grandinella TaxID=5974 RepID=A0A8J8T5S3_HALGN|nr:hypothetical protein FGO68_gene15782 [Halteria grandinella]
MVFGWRLPCINHQLLQIKGINTKQELQVSFSKQTVNEFVKGGLTESQATAIMEYCKNILQNQHRNAGPILPRLASKYLSLQIVGYAYVQHEAIDLTYLCIRARLVFIQNFELFKSEIIKAKKTVIESVFQLLDERLLSKKYMLHLSSFFAELVHCVRIYKEKLQFYKISIKRNYEFLLTNFRPIIIEIGYCEDMTSFFALLPSSVINLNIHQHDYFTPDASLIPRKFRMLTLGGGQLVDILNHYATTSEALIIQPECLKEPEIFDYLTHFDCKEIIIETNLQFQECSKFLTCQSKAVKYFEFSEMDISNIQENQWAFEHKRSFDDEFLITIKSYQIYSNAQALYEALFQGPLSKLKKLKIDLYDHIEFDPNVCFPQQNNVLEELEVVGEQHTEAIIVMALNNCKKLNKLIKKADYIRQCYKCDRFFDGCKLSRIDVSATCLQDFQIGVDRGHWGPLIKDILEKSKETLQSLGYDGNIDSLRNSKILKKYKCRFAKDIDQSFQNLKSLTCEQIIGSLPESLETIHLQVENKSVENIADQIQQNPKINKVTLGMYYKHSAAYFLEAFKHIKLNFKQLRNGQNSIQSIFTFHQAIAYLHPEYEKQIHEVTTDPDHIVYELLFQRLTNKSKLLSPYIEAVYYDYEPLAEYMVHSPSRMLDQLAYFDEFQGCLGNMADLGNSQHFEKLYPYHFQKVFNSQLKDIDDEEYLLIIVSTYDEVFELGGNITQTINMLKGMTQEQRQTLKRRQYFYHCKENWKNSLSQKDFYQENEIEHYYSEEEDKGSQQEDDDYYQEDEPEQNAQQDEDSYIQDKEEDNQ